ncbi:NAD(P)/FAD-dependent oxidoreductase [Bradyrhizobium lablabi]|uniref:dihydrolipoyl dehydrogenase family protein n=1 Tax=Bradyrhizobium lablabi TaxID=722472 RepID=UPI001BABE5F9|nr:FAD-dependent oxidoreductase [Bradyrhizobium lablabi]MBR0695650.1 FAD-dependent oxidoreductase [Bradyrhizobium lablabi]
MAQSETFDIVILGSGQGGKKLAWHLGRSGKKVAVVERQWVGGSCPAVACLPSKNEIWGARVAHLVHNSAHFGIVADRARTDMAAVRLRKQRMVEFEIDAHLNLYKQTGAELIMGTGRFIGAKTIDVRLNKGGTRVLAGNEVVINVGTHAAMPDIPGLREAQPLTHIEALELDIAPEHLIILGGGYIGVEMAQAYRRFGSRVTIIEPASRIMGREDSEVATEISKVLTGEGIDIILGGKPLRVDGRSGQSVSVTIATEPEQRTVEGSHLLVAVGRIANTADIGLDKAGVALTPRGFIQVDERLRTTAPGVWAIGECAGSPHFTHVSVDDFRIVRDNMAGGNRSTDDRLIPHVMFTDPPLARVGLSEGEAQRQGMPFRAATLPMRNVLRTLATDEPEGFMKVLVGAKDDRILGFTMIGSEAGEVMTTVQAAMLAEMPYTKLRDAVIAHLTIAEGLGSLFEGIPVKSA